MNDRWLYAAQGIVEDALAELLDVGERLAALPVHSPAREPLALRAADLEHRIAAASGVLHAYHHAGAPGERYDDEGGGAAPLPCPTVMAATARRAA